MENDDLFLIYPPCGKACEPPAGVALLGGALKRYQIACKVMDANLEAQLWLKGSSNHLSGKWSARAVSHWERNLSDLRNPDLYSHEERYRQRVMDVNRVISSSLDPRFRMNLADYGDLLLSPVKSQDLIFSAENFSANPFFSYFEEKLLPRIEAFNPSFIGISLCYLSQALTSFALAGWIRSRFPGVRIIMGGGLVTSWMSSPLWNNPFNGIVDLMVKGRGEEKVLELFGILPDKRERFSPDYDFCDWDKYLAPGRILPFRTAIGCYWSKCRFCPERAEGGRYRPEKNQDLLKDMTDLYRRYRPDYLHFLDDALSPSFLRTLAKEELPFTWYGFVRFTNDLTDPDFCRALFRSGCRMLKLGLESGDQNVLDRMNKGTRLETVTKVLYALREANIATYVYLLFGTSFETEKGAEKTLAYVADQSERIGFLNSAVFNLPRFSEDAANLVTDQFYGADLSLYLNFNHPHGWDRKKVRLFLEKRFKKHPAIAPILRRDPPFFTSNHAMFVSPYSR